MTIEKQHSVARIRSYLDVQVGNILIVQERHAL